MTDEHWRNLDHCTRRDRRGDPAITAAWRIGQELIDITYTWPDGTVETTPTFGGMKE